MAQQPLEGQGLSLSRLRDHTPVNTPHLVGLLWTSDQPDAEIYTWRHITLTRQFINAPGGIRTLNPSKQAAADPHLRPRGHWDRLLNGYHA